MKLYFVNSNDERKCLGKCSMGASISRIKEFVKSLDSDFQISYYRTWQNRYDETIIDVGSWSEFFILTDQPEDIVLSRTGV